MPGFFLKEANMSGSSRAVALQWVTPPVVVPALIALAIFVMWLKI